MRTFKRRAAGALTALLLTAVSASSTSMHVDDANIDHAAVVKMLLEAGANPNERSETGETALMKAAGNADNVRALLAAGADVDAADENGWTPLHRAASEGHAETAGILLAAGANPNARTDRASTPLHFAASSGYRTVVNLLLVAGADIHVKNVDGETPLLQAVEQGGFFGWHRPVWPADYNDIDIEIEDGLDE